MFKKKKQREEFSTFARTMDKLINSKDATEKRVYEYEGRMYQYHNQLIEEHQKNETLTRENEHLKMLFDKESDTQVIKYQGKIYRIENITHYSGVGEPDTLNICATFYGEVNTDGESKM